MKNVNAKKCHRCLKRHRCAGDICYSCKMKEKEALSLTTHKTLGYCLICGCILRRTASVIYCYDCSLLVIKAYVKAKSQVSKAIKDGLLVDLKTGVDCVDCGRPASVYEHRYYLKPLDVVPVCRSCNTLRGPALDVIEAAADGIKPAKIARRK